MHCRRKWQPTPVFLPRESHGQRSLVVTIFFLVFLFQFFLLQMPFKGILVLSSPLPGHLSPQSLGLSWNMQDHYLHHVGSSSQTRDWTRVPCIGSRVLATGPPGTSQDLSVWSFQAINFWLYSLLFCFLFYFCLIVLISFFQLALYYLLFFSSFLRWKVKLLL